MIQHHDMIQQNLSQHCSSFSVGLGDENGPHRLDVTAGFNSRLTA